MIEGQDNQPVDQNEEQEEYRAAFGLPPIAEEQEQNDDEQDEQPEFDDVDDEHDEEEDPDQDTPSETARKLRIKYNGEERELDEEEAITLAQKGMNYDKQQERLNKQQEALDRTARIHGFKDHSDYMDHLDDFEKTQIDQQRMTLQEHEQQLVNALVNAGYEESDVRNLIDSNPAIRAGREALQNREQERELEQQRQREAEESKGWEELLVAYPDLSKQVQDGRAPWMTEEMLAKIKRGYSPLDAYEILNRDELMKAQRKRAEQDVIKNNRLNRRAEQVRDGKGQYEKQATSELKSAFAAFGLNPDQANKYAKK
ncbi:hypothetical protein ACFSGI_09000 [Paenibacillus nicotianae]|uniref:Uncharacterized protein n=1 Tax=Paenibacillus nicotianae TaxID=1526551 RepID=A0ABW4UVE1_9BACL